MTDIKKWSVLSDLNEDIASNIKQLYGFGANGQQVIIITNDDTVYAFGANNNGCLGIGRKTHEREKLTKINDLSHKSVVDIQFGASYNFVLALTRDNQVFSWGSNEFGQLGTELPRQTKICLLPTIIKELTGKNVTDIKCGQRHCLALTHNGQLYYWGCVHNYLNEYKPKLMVNVNEHNIISIACGYHNSLVRTDKGSVYSWDNKLQTDEYNSEMTKGYPRLISLVPVITKIRCGADHNLLLSSDGDIYSFGNNSHGQCGGGYRKPTQSLEKLDVSNKFVDIATAKCDHISVGLSADGFCYFWGECGKQRIHAPTKIRMNKIIDVLEYFSSIKVTFDRIYYENDYKQCNQNAIMFSNNKFIEKFNKQEYSDIAFKIENNCIYAQKLYLKSVCNHLDVMFSSDYWRECNENVIEITQYSYPVYYAFIQYLYINVVNIKPEYVIELLDLSNAYFEEELKQKCVEIIKGSVSIDNVFRTYSHAIQYKSDELRQHCVNYLYDNMKDKSIVEIILEKFSRN